VQISIWVISGKIWGYGLNNAKNKFNLRRLFRKMTSIIASLVLGYVAILVLIYFMQSHLVYHPYSAITSTPADLGYEFEDVEIRTDDGLKLHGWFVPEENADITVLFFHGNAGNISGRLETLRLLHQLGLNVLIFDYRGYGRSQGRPTEEGTYRDAAATWKYLTEHKNISEDEIIVMGRSLGGSVAAWLASRRNPAAVILESTFTSAADLGSEIYPWLPVRWLISFKYETRDYIKQISAPIFVVHSRDDKVVPFHHGETLFNETGEPRQFLELRGSHGSGFLETGARYQNALKDFLNQHTSYQTKIEN
jgi:pimeloyl-ACP methyl ester carboxylesterase